jgi:hypothetical protein
MLPLSVCIYGQMWWHHWVPSSHGGWEVGMLPKPNKCACETGTSSTVLSHLGSLKPPEFKILLQISFTTTTNPSFHYFLGSLQLLMAAGLEYRSGAHLVGSGCFRPFRSAGTLPPTAEKCTRCRPKAWPYFGLRTWNSHLHYHTSPQVPGLPPSNGTLFMKYPGRDLGHAWYSCRNTFCFLPMHGSGLGPMWVSCGGHSITIHNALLKISYKFEISNYSGFQHCIFLTTLSGVLLSLFSLCGITTACGI